MNSSNFPSSTGADGIFNNRNIDSSQHKISTGGTGNTQSIKCIAWGCNGILETHIAPPNHYRCSDCGRVFTLTLVVKFIK